MATPLAGVWIEISVILTFPSFSTVTPLAGVWIEIGKPSFRNIPLLRHSPCGSVD